MGSSLIISFYMFESAYSKRLKLSLKLDSSPLELTFCDREHSVQRVTLLERLFFLFVKKELTSVIASGNRVSKIDSISLLM